MNRRGWPRVALRVLGALVSATVIAGVGGPVAPSSAGAAACYPLTDDDVARAPRPADSRADSQARSVLLDLSDLRSRSDGRVLIGQQLAPWEETFAKTYSREVQSLKDTTGKTPALLSVDYDDSYDSYKGGPVAALHDMNQGLISHAEACGYVSVMWHARNPWTGEDSGHTTRGSIDDLLDPATAVGARWRSYLDRVTGGLRELQTAGVPVLFRPFHEMNGSWFWWGKGDGTADSPAVVTRMAEFKRLWNATFDYFTTTKGLHNLLWVYSAAAESGWDQIAPVDAFYPGGRRVDVTALDAYVDGSYTAGGYPKLAALGKPFGFSEYGASEDSPMLRAPRRGDRFDQAAWAKRLATDYKRAVFATAWVTSGDRYWSIVDTKRPAAYMYHPVTRTLELGVVRP